MRHFNPFLCTLLSLLFANSPVAAQLAEQRTGDPPNKHSSFDNEQSAEAFSFNEIGAKATAEYQGDAIAIVATPTGAHLRSGFQKLEGSVDGSGLTLTSTADQGGSIKLVASGFGREGSIRSLPRTGIVTASEELVSYARPGLVEEYSVSADGVRQDFIIAQRPSGTGDLHVNLALDGAKATPAGDGVLLTLDRSGRELAYNKLYVTDARGQELVASLVVSDDQLVVHVSDANAVYPVRIDPVFSDADWVSLGTFYTGTSDEIYSAVIDPDGALIIGGTFDFAGGIPMSNIVKWDGSDWTSLGTGMNGGVLALITIGMDVYAGGDFTTAGGVATEHIAKWDGSSWTPLGSGTNGSVRALNAIGADLYAGGLFTTANGILVDHVAKWNGNDWSALGSGTNDIVQALTTIGADLYAGGAFTTADGNSANGIAMWDGNVWSALGSGTNGNVYSLGSIGTDLFAGGDFTSAGGASAANIAKWDGNSWSGLGSGTSGEVKVLTAVGFDLYVGGGFSTAGGLTVNSIAKWDGSSWSALGSGMDAYVEVIVVSGTDLFIGGDDVSVAGGIDVDRIAKWDGSEWSSLSTGLSSTVRALALIGSDLYAGGNFYSLGGRLAGGIAKWDGNHWSVLGSGTDGFVRSLVSIGTDLYVGGSFDIAGGISAINIAKWDGNSWSALGSGTNSDVTGLATIGTDLYVIGSFSNAGGVPSENIAKWDGSAWSTLGSGLNNEANAIVALGTDLFVGGRFSTAGGGPANNIAKWDGVSWSSLGSGVDDDVFALQSIGTDVYAAGSFLMAGGIAADHIAKWDGQNWSALGLGVDNEVLALTSIGTNLYAAGRFTTAGSVAADRIAQWDGSNWSALGSGLSDTGRALVADQSGGLYVGGSFQTAGTILSSYVAKALVGPCDPPVITSITNSGPSCFQPAIDLNVIAAGTGPFTYEWTGPNTIIDNTLANTTTIVTVDGSYDYEVTVTNGCGSATASTTVEFANPPSGGFSYLFNGGPPYFCTQGSPVGINAIGLTFGGTFSAPAGLAVDPQTGLVDVANSVADFYLVTYTYSDGICPGFTTTAGFPLEEPRLWYPDQDGDGAGDQSSPGQSSCYQISNYVLNADDDCPFVFGQIGSSCDDGDPNTLNDVIGPDCVCAGSAACDPPVITSITNNGPTCGEGLATVSAIVSGTEPLTYDWTGDGISLIDGSSIDVEVTTPGSYEYVLTVSNDCGSDQSSTTWVYEQPTGLFLWNPLGGGVPAGAICELLTNVPPITSILTPGGTYSGSAGLVIDPVTGAVNPAASGVGSYTATYTIPAGACPEFVGETNLSVYPAFIYYADDDNDGAGDPATSEAVCFGGQTQGWVTNADDDCPLIFGQIGSSCDDGDPNTLNDVIGPDCVCAGSTACDPPVITSISNNGPTCGEGVATMSISVSGTAPLNYSWTGDGITSSTNLASITAVANAPGTYDYEVSVSNDCGSDQITTSWVYEQPSGIFLWNPLGGGVPPGAICELRTDVPPLNSELTPGGTYSGSAGLVIDPLTGAVDAAASGVGEYTVTYTIPAGACPEYVVQANFSVYPAFVYYADDDGDGAGDPATFEEVCYGGQTIGWVTNADDDCPLIFGQIGSTCDDGNPNSLNDVIGLDCICAGDFTTAIPNAGMEIPTLRYDRANSLIQVQHAGTHPVLLLDATGRLLKNTKGPNAMFNVADLPPAMYLIRVGSNTHRLFVD